MFQEPKILTREELVKIKKSEVDETGFRKWASYGQMSEVPEGLWDTLFRAAMVYCYDAVNLVFELHSSTSGMYGHWEVNVSPSCTVYLNLLKDAPRGSGGTFSSALADFTLKCLDLKDKLEKEKQEKENGPVQLPA